MWASMCVYCRSQHSWWKAHVLVSASPAMRSAPQPSCCEQLSFLAYQRVPGLRMLALARSSTFLSDAACGTPRFPRGRQAIFCRAGCSGGPSGHPVGASCRYQYSWWRESVLVSASSASVPAPRPSCCEQLSYPLSQRVPCLRMLALARSSAFLSDATCGTPPRSRERQAFPAGQVAVVVQSGHPWACLAGLSTAGGGRLSSFLLRRPCCQLLGCHVAASCNIMFASVSHASACWR